jgi:hypothetical protein
MIDTRGSFLIAHTVSESTRIKSKGLSIDVSYHLSYAFSRAAPRTKSMGLLIDVPYHLAYTFFTRNATYKKQVAHDYRLISFILCFFHA